MNGLVWRPRCSARSVRAIVQCASLKQTTGTSSQLKYVVCIRDLSISRLVWERVSSPLISFTFLPPRPVSLFGIANTLRCLWTGNEVRYARHLMLLRIVTTLTGCSRSSVLEYHKHSRCSCRRSVTTRRSWPFLRLAGFRTNYRRAGIGLEHLYYFASSVIVAIQGIT